MEGIAADCSDGIWNGHGSKPGAAGESKIADKSDGVGDGHGSKFRAAVEGLVADRSNGVGNSGIFTAKD